MEQVFVTALQVISESKLWLVLCHLTAIHQSVNITTSSDLVSEIILFTYFHTLCQSRKAQHILDWVSHSLY